MANNNIATNNSNGLHVISNLEMPGYKHCKIFWASNLSFTALGRLNYNALVTCRGRLRCTV